jgi:dTDP-4-dehydrorhamnose 3,5-epimerase
MFCRDELKSIGWDKPIVQINLTHTKSKGAIRGLHFQRPPYAEKKLVSCTIGEVWDVVVDLRRTEPTYGKHFKIELSAKNATQLFIPEGFAHGFCSLDKENIVYYGCSKYREKNYEIGILWNDKDLNIKWPIKKPILSQKDLRNISFEEYRDKYWTR